MNTEMLVRIGAEARLQALKVEEAELLGFLKKGRANGHTNGVKVNGMNGVERPKRKWSAAARKATSLRMKAMWAAKRKAKK